MLLRSEFRGNYGNVVHSIFSYKRWVEIPLFPKDNLLRPWVLQDGMRRFNLLDASLGRFQFLGRKSVRDGKVWKN